MRNCPTSYIFLLSKIATFFMDNWIRQIIYLSPLVFPILCSIIGLIMLLLSYQNSVTNEESNRKRSLIIYFSLMSGMWIGIFLYFFAKDIFYIILPIHIFFVLSTQAALYFLIRNLIIRQSSHKQLYLHYLPATMLSFFSVIFIYLSPIHSDKKIIPWILTGYFLSSLVYFILTCYQLFKRNLELQSMKPEDIPRPVSWIILLILLSFLILFSAAIPIFSSAEYYVYWMYAGSTMGSIQSMILIYNLICPYNMVFKYIKEGKSMVWQEKINVNTSVRIPHARTFVLGQKSFETLIVKNKLYTDPYISLETLVEQLGIDQPTLSSFIRTTYNMNFRQYLNDLRLNEMEQLLSLPANNGKTPADFINQVGFGSLRSYQRCKMKRSKEIGGKKKYRF